MTANYGNIRKTTEPHTSNGENSKFHVMYFLPQ